ncbi:MAG: hypothetical protein NTW28_34075 [Candidatus Solibacter sp.]|nr:hypothetical protein [Candidatus Solibacter sp.]
MPAIDPVFYRLKLQTAKRLELYRNHIGQNLHAEDLQRLISAHILVTLRSRGQAGGTETLHGAAEKELRDRIAAEPAIGIELVREDLLPASGLVRTVQRDMEESARALAADFSTAYSRIAHPVVGKLAVQWLQGNQLAPGEMRDLGVSLNGIERPEQAWLALGFLLEAYRRAELPFLLCIDEHERMTFRGQDVDQKASWGLLKDLAEAFVGSGHVLIVSGVSEAWDSLPEDVYARIRREDITEIALERQEAPKLLRAYAPDLEKVFSPKALDRLYDVSQNNARRLLDLAHQAYKVRADGSGPLGPEAIRDITRSALGDRNRKASLADAMEESAGALGVSVERDVDFRGVRFDFVLSGTERRRILVQVSESAFLLDEIDHGREIVDAQMRLAEERARIRTCAIMIGYSSFEVRDALERVVDRVLLFDEAKFRNEFQEWASGALKEMADERPPVPVPEIASATRLLNSSEAARAGKLARVQTALAEASAPQQQRQDELLARQADEQMASAIERIRSLLATENEHLVRLDADNVREAYAEATLRSIELLNAQQDELRRARTVAERDGAGSGLAPLLERYRSWVVEADAVWQTLVRVGGSTKFSDAILRTIASRRAVLHEIEERWLTRGRPRWSGLVQPLVALPLALALLIFGWLGVDYWQERKVQQDAVTELQKSLTGLIEFAVGYAGDPLDAAKQFSAKVGPFERALLNPRAPAIGERPTSDLREEIGSVNTLLNIIRAGGKLDPDEKSTLYRRVTGLQSRATEALRGTYSVREVSIFSYLQIHVAPLYAALSLIGLALLRLKWRSGRRWWA